MSTEKNDDEKSATVIQWPGTRAPTPTTEGREATTPPDATTADAAVAKPPTEGASASGTTANADEMTMDAFEAAVRRAVHDKLGVDVPQFPPRGADELVAQVLSALSGKDPKAALAEVREHLANAGQHEPAGADIIDLSAAREARKKVSTETTQRVSGALKDTFNQFLANLSASQGNRTEIVLDTQFFKEHGSSLLGSLFQGLASALLSNAKPGEPAPPPAPPAAATPTEPSAETPSATTETPAPEPAPVKEPVQVNVKVDFASIFQGLFRRRAPTPPPTTTPPPGGDEPPKT
ncbi:MAG: hypothetical protein U1F43_30005 [Myxococcota bacterium]